MLTPIFTKADIIDEINNIRCGNGTLLSHSWVNIPMVYTQLVTIAVYVYFSAALFGRQYLDLSEGRTILGYDAIGYFFNIAPIFLVLEFVFLLSFGLYAFC